jgi:hypothetical protein
MIDLTHGQRSMLADKLPDAANLSAGALFFGQFLSDRPFSFVLALSGIVSWFALFSWALVLTRKKDP